MSDNDQVRVCYRFVSERTEPKALDMRLLNEVGREGSVSMSENVSVTVREQSFMGLRLTHGRLFSFELPP